MVNVANLFGSQAAETSSFVSPEQELVQRHTNNEPGDLLYHLAVGDLSGLLACKSGAGKTTSLHYCLVEYHNAFPRGTLTVADSKGSGWLGLENCPGVVYQLVTDRPHYPESASELDPDTLLVASELVALSEVIDKTWRRYRDRVKMRAKRAKEGQPQPEFEPHLTVIDDWFGLLDKWNRFPPSVRKDLGIHNLTVKLNDIISRGRELRVRVLLITQSHLVKEVGLSGAMKESVVTVAQGRESEDEGSGFGSVQRLVKDHNVFPDEVTREALKQSLRFAIATVTNPDSVYKGTPVLASTQGKGFVGLADDLRWASDQNIGFSYMKHHPELSAKQRRLDAESSPPSPNLQSSQQVIEAIIRIAEHLRDDGQPKISASNVMQYSRAAEPTKVMDADSIRAYFPIIAATNIATIEGDRDRMLFVLNKDYRSADKAGS
ncbi:MAG: hypothetical protein ACFCA4_12505 [Cyanophyceae cyanobacterium]